jgi:hypothetical protein
MHKPTPYLTNYLSWMPCQIKSRTAGSRIAVQRQGIPPTKTEAQKIQIQKFPKFNVTAIDRVTFHFSCGGRVGGVSSISPVI